MSFSRPISTSFPSSSDLSILEWTSEIVQLGSIPLGNSRWRVNFTGIELVGNGGASNVSVNIATQQNANAAVNDGEHEPANGSFVDQGCCLIWSSQVAADRNFSKVFLWDASLPGYVDLTAVASSYTPDDTPLATEAADILYLGRPAKTTIPTITVRAGTQLAVGGGPLIVQYFNGSSWVASPVLDDVTRAFSVSGAAYNGTKTIPIEIGYQDDEQQTAVNGVTLYWTRIQFTSDPAVAPIVTRLAWYHNIDGVLMHAPLTVYPQWQHYFADIDGGGNTGLQVNARDYRALHAAIPLTVRWRFERIATAVYPVRGDLWRHGDTGRWRDLRSASDGAGYTAWLASVELGGVWTSVATYYQPRAIAERLDQSGFVMNFLQEMGTLGPLTDNPSEIHYSRMRVFDSATNRWHYLLDWNIYEDPLLADPNYGFSVQRLDGVLTSTIGVAGSETTVGTKQLIGLLPRMTSGASLPPKGINPGGYIAGGITYRGPIWTNGTAAAPFNPLVVQEHDRGYYVVHPGAVNGAVLAFVADDSGTYTFTGDFARANDSSGSGDGVDVTVTSGAATLFSAHVTNTATVDPDDIFGAGNASVEPFAVSVGLDAGSEVLFSVVAGGTTTFDATAFRVAVTFTDAVSRRIAADPGDAPEAVQVIDSDAMTGDPKILFDDSRRPIDILIALKKARERLIAYMSARS